MIAETWLIPTLIMNLYQRLRIMSGGTTWDTPTRVRKAEIRDTRGLQEPSPLRASPKWIAPPLEKRVALPSRTASIPRIIA